MKKKIIDFWALDYISNFTISQNDRCSSSNRKKTNIYYSTIYFRFVEWTMKQRHLGSFRMFIAEGRYATTITTRKKCKQSGKSVTISRKIWSKRIEFMLHKHPYSISIEFILTPMHRENFSCIAKITIAGKWSKPKARQLKQQFSSLLAGNGFSSDFFAFYFVLHSYFVCIYLNRFVSSPRNRRDCFDIVEVYNILYILKHSLLFCSLTVVVYVCLHQLFLLISHSVLLLYSTLCFSISISSFVRLLFLFFLKMFQRVHKCFVYFIFLLLSP